MAIKLYDTVSVSAFLEVQKILEKSLKDDFNEIKKVNYQKSLKYNYDYLVKASKEMKIPKITKFSDISPSFIQEYHDNYIELTRKYQDEALGPAQSEAFSKFISIDFNTSHLELLDDLDLAFKEDINNTQIRIRELNKVTDSSYQLDNLNNLIAASEEQKEKLSLEKQQIEEDIEDLQQIINDSTSEHSKKVELRVLELESNKKLIETRIKEKQDIINEYTKEIDNYEVQLQDNKDQKLTLQRDKIKEVNTR